MTTINVKYMTDEAVETLRSNLEVVTSRLQENLDSSQWLRSYLPGEIYITKKYEIEDFQLEIPESSKDRETDYRNSILLYERLKNLPQHVLSDERFWMWMNFEMGYQAVLKFMFPNKESVFRDHWLFTQGNRRGLMFGVLSRAYYRVAFSVDESLKDKYEYSRFVIENPERFRGYTWRAYSNQKKLILGALKAEKRVLRECNFPEKNKLYSELAKAVSKKASVMLLDVMSESDIEDFVFNTYCKLIEEAAK